jgi:hypothetical protein
MAEDPAPEALTGEMMESMIGALDEIATLYRIDEVHLDDLHINNCAIPRTVRTQ